MPGFCSLFGFGEFVGPREDAVGAVTDSDPAIELLTLSSGQFCTFPEFGELVWPMVAVRARKRVSVPIDDPIDDPIDGPDVVEEPLPDA
jgi:hypothetical protein